jgi:hypothetical protein
MKIQTMWKFGQNSMNDSSDSKSMTGNEGSGMWKEKERDVFPVRISQTRNWSMRSLWKETIRTNRHDWKGLWSIILTRTSNAFRTSKMRLKYVDIQRVADSPGAMIKDDESPKSKIRFLPQCCSARGSVIDIFDRPQTRLQLQAQPILRVL